MAYINESSEKSTNQSVTKLMQLFEYLSESRVPMRLQDIAAAIGVSQATTSRYLNALVMEGYVFQDKIASRYAPTWKICRLGDATKVHMSLRTISSDVINELTQTTDLGICLVIEQGLECIYLDCIYDPRFSLMRIGKRTPMHAASSGKILLSAYSEAELDRYIEMRELSPLTDRTITSKEALIADLEQVRQKGYAIDDEECEIGLRCIAVPVYSYHERPVAALSIFGAAEQLTEERIQQNVLPILKESSAEISIRLGSDRYKGKH